jgi:DNA-binding CsgD family transcriptional regulator
MNSEVLQRVSDTTSRAELFALFTAEFTQHGKPVVLVIEDIHWADEATLDFIKFFARRISRTNCLMVLTFRDDITQNHPLRNILGELSPDTFTRIQLPPLSREAVQKMADEKGYIGEDVYLVSGGNPFYVTEIVASYSAGVPENVKDSILTVYNCGAEVTRNAWQLLSVMPEGLYTEWIPTIDEHFPEAIESCFTHGIIIHRNNRIFFKHELYRRTIESSLSPFRRLQLNKTVLQLFLPFFEKQGAIERIVHYAKNAGDHKLVVQYAPVAAKQAASVGAHAEAAKLYLAAIEYADVRQHDLMVQLYENYTYECYLTNQIKDAIIYQSKALKLWQERGDTEQIGNSLRFLSRLWWYDGHRKEAESYGMQAIEIFESQPASKAKAMAFSNLSQLKMLSEEVHEAIKWGTLAIDMAKELKDEETFCHALNNVGTVRWRIPGMHAEGKILLEESLSLALKNSYHEHAARAYTNLISCSVSIKDYETARKYLAEGLQYCEERDLHSWMRYNLSWRAKLLLDTGDWDEAYAIATNLLSHPAQPGIIKIGALVIAATINMRRGEGDGAALLHQAKALAVVTKEHQRILPVIVACLEYEWLTGGPILDDEDLDITVTLMRNVENIYLNSEAVFWFRKARPADTKWQQFYQHSQQGKEAKANGIVFQNAAEEPYKKALSKFNGNEDDKRDALALLQSLGAETVYQKLKQEMRSLGIKKIPRGLRSSTKSNAAQLTVRELDILHLLKTGAQNKEIATSLFISPKTVDHHISSILFKLDVPSRIKAVTEAEKLGILK